MAKTTWTIFDEALHRIAATVQHELKQTHGASFAAAFLDEFEDQLRALAARSLPPSEQAEPPP